MQEGHLRAPGPHKGPAPAADGREPDPRQQCERQDAQRRTAAVSWKVLVSRNEDRRRRLAQALEPRGGPRHRRLSSSSASSSSASASAVLRTKTVAFRVDVDDSEGRTGDAWRRYVARRWLNAMGRGGGAPDPSPGAEGEDGPRVRADERGERDERVARWKLALERRNAQRI